MTNAATPKLFWMHLAGGALILGSTHDDLVAAVMGPGLYRPGMTQEKKRVGRAAWLVGFATAWQSDLIRRGLATESFSWAGATDREITRLNTGKANPDLFVDEPWEGRVPLILVDPGDGCRMPDGALRLDAGSAVDSSSGFARQDSSSASAPWAREGLPTPRWSGRRQAGKGRCNAERLAAQRLGADS
jgi:hypothetical protein